MWQGFPREARDKLENFLEENYQLTKFLDSLEHEREFLVNRPTIPNMKKTEEKKDEVTLPPPVQAAPFQSTSETDQLKNQLKELSEKMALINSRPQLGPYCTYCKSNTHASQECYRRPPPGECYDCWRPNSRRGNAGCPGRRIRTN